MNHRLALIIALFIAVAFLSAGPSASDAASRFEDMGNGAVMDRDTGLMWLKDAMPADTGMPYQMAVEYVEKLNEERFLGHADWRIPRIEDLLSLVEEGRQYPAIASGAPFVDVRPGFYWSSSTGYDVVGYAWALDMGSGAVKHAEASYCNFYYVWPVRTEDEGAWRAPERYTRQRIEDRARVLPGYLDLLKDREPGPDLISPRTPLSVAAAAISKDEIMVTWKPAEPERKLWYNVHSEGSNVRAVEGLSVRIKGLKPRTRKCFTVTARGSSGPESEPSREVCATTWKGDIKQGTVWAEGLNSFGQLGDGTRVNAIIPVLVEGLEDVTRVSAGVEHSLAVRSDGTVWAWGRNTRGQLGDGTTSNSAVPRKVKSLEGIVDVSAGWYHSLALSKDGTVWAWGRNYYGQLGDGTKEDRLEPVKVIRLKNIKKISAGWYHSMALSSDGKVWVWGWNRYGQLGDAEIQEALEPVKVPGLPKITDIAGGMEHSVALSDDGTARAWGRNDHGQLGYGARDDSAYPVKVRGLSGAREIECGMNYCLALLPDGGVSGWGRNDYGQLGKGQEAVVPEAIRLDLPFKAVLLAAGAHQGAAVGTDGNLWVWGWNYTEDEKNLPPATVGHIAGFDRISAGVHFILVLKGR